MELREAISSIQCLDLDIDEKGVIRSRNRPELWFGLLDGDILRLACPTKSTHRDEIPLSEIQKLGTLEVDYVLSIETDDGWDFCNAAYEKLDPPPERRSDAPLPDLDDVEVISIDDINQLRKGKLREFNQLFPVLFPDAENCIYYDELKESVMVDMSLFGRPQRKAQRMTDDILAVYHLAVENALHKNGIKPEFSWTVMDEQLKVWSEDHRRNSFLDWVESLKWDGKPRLDTMFRDLLGGRAAALDAEDEATYLAAVARAWLTGAIARCYGSAKHEIVPVLISKTQGMGKGTALSALAGREEWFNDVTRAPKDIEKFLEAVRGRIIIELSEGASLRGKAEDIKAFISQREDQMRKPYGRYEATYPRHFILAISTNNPTLFTDVTGNRRFFPMHCDPKRASISGAEAHEYVCQLWAEVYYAYHHGALPFMTDEEQDLAEAMQDYATVEDGNVIAIDDYLDEPMNGLTEIGSKISRAFIMEHVFGYSGNLVPKDLENAYRIWTMGTKRWEKAPGTIRVDGKPARGYIRIYKPGEKPKTEKLPITKTGAIGTLDEEFAKLCEGKEIGDMLHFERFYVKDMSRERAIQALLDDGRIYSRRSHGIDEYYLGDKP